MPTAEQTVTSTIVWFEIPATNFPRAIRFYETILGSPMHHEDAWPNLAIFPYQRPGVSGAIAYGDGFRPSADGVVIYLNCEGKFDQVLSRVEAAGGSIVEPKNHLPSVGWVAQIRDSEGNRIGLHSAQ